MNQAIGKLLVTVVLSFAMTIPALATPMGFNFLYEFGTGEIFSGMLEGELQADRDTVIVTDVLMATFSDLPGVGFQTDMLSSSNIVKISGVGGDWGSIAPADGLAAFVMPFNQLGGVAVIATESNIAFRAETFAAERWSLTAKEVPLPATLWLIGMAGVLLYRQRA